MRPTAPEIFLVGEPPTLELVPDDDEPPTERRPELVEAWARVMCLYQEASPS